MGTPPHELIDSSLNEFEWPPREAAGAADDPLSVFPASDEGRRDAPATLLAAAPAIRQLLVAQQRPSATLQRSEHRSSASATEPPESRKWLTPARLAFVLLALVAAVEGAYILRVHRGPSSASSTSRGDVGLIAHDGPATAAAPAAPSTIRTGVGKTEATNTKAGSAEERKGRKEAASSGRITFSSGVDLDVFENDTLVGNTRTPELPLSAGRHKLRLVNETVGFDQVQEVTIKAGRSQQLTVQLPTGKLNVNAVPWAEVVIDGSLVGETPIGNLPLTIGRHEILFRHPQFGEKTVSAIVTLGPPVRVSVDMRSPTR